MVVYKINVITVNQYNASVSTLSEKRFDITTKNFQKSERMISCVSEYAPDYITRNVEYYLLDT